MNFPFGHIPNNSRNSIFDPIYKGRCSFYTLFITLILVSCSSDPSGTDAKEAIIQEKGNNGFSLNFQVLAETMLEQANLQEGERVMMVGMPGRFDPIVPLLVEGIVEAGAVYIGTFSVEQQGPTSWKTDFIAQAPTDEQELVDMFSYLKEVDLGIMLPGATPEHFPYAAMQEVLRSGQGRTIHFHWAGAYGPQGLPLDIDPTIDSIYQHVLLTTNYAELAEAQKAFEQAMRGNNIHVTTPEGTDIQFDIGDRPVTKQDGDASRERSMAALNLIDREIELPAGAVRVAPIEESVQGKIVFPYSYWDSVLVSDLEMSFEKGRIVSMQAEEGLEAVETVLEKGGESARSFREFALGMNPLLTTITAPDTIIPYYAYGSGLVRLSLGDNGELGGKVGGGFVRWNFFTNASVKVGDEVWVKEGKLIK